MALAHFSSNVLAQSINFTGGPLWLRQDTDPGPPSSPGLPSSGDVASVPVSPAAALQSCRQKAELQPSQEILASAHLSLRTP